VSGALHVLTVGALAALPLLTPLAWPFWGGLVLIAAVLFYEHWIVRPNDLSRIDKAFFDLNGYVSLLFFGFVYLGWILT
jgi:4-hydroxybenzoate polyprenyltransferase